MVAQDNFLQSIALNTIFKTQGTRSILPYVLIPLVSKSKVSQTVQISEDRNDNIFTVNDNAVNEIASNHFSNGKTLKKDVISLKERHYSKMLLSS